MHEGEGVKLYWTLIGKDNDYSLLINELVSRRILYEVTNNNCFVILSIAVRYLWKC